MCRYDISVDSLAVTAAMAPTQLSYLLFTPHIIST